MFSGPENLRGEPKHRGALPYLTIYRLAWCTGTAFYAIYLRTFARDQLMAFLGELFSRRWALPQHATSTSDPQSTTSH